MVKIFNDNIPFNSDFSFNGVYQRRSSMHSATIGSIQKQSLSDMTRRDTVSAMRTHIAVSDNKTISSIASKEV